MNFSVNEWLKNKTAVNILLLSWLDFKRVINKIELWIAILNPIRERLGFPIVITDGYRYGSGTSQHLFEGDGATDLRAGIDPDYDNRMKRLAEQLADHPEIYRVCYYPKGKMFPRGGFHIDRKTKGKLLFISHPDSPSWRLVSRKEFIEAL